MKQGKFLIILLALGLVFTSYKWISSTNGGENEPVKSATIEDIMTRTSVRAYTDAPVSSEAVDTLLRAAMAAPTAANRQPWRFVVITDRTMLNRIAADFSTMPMAAEAALAIVACGDTTVTLPGEGRDYWVQDVSAATENLLLAAHAMGLGAVWCGIYPLSERVEAFSGMLNLPSEIIPMACICIGHPSGQPSPKDKWKPENVRYNTWSAK